MSFSLSRPNAQTSRRVKIVSTLAAVVALLIVIAPTLVDLYARWEWFREVAYTSVFSTVWVSRIVLFLVAGLIGGLGAYLAAALAFRFRPSRGFADSGDSVGIEDLFGKGGLGSLGGGLSGRFARGEGSEQRTDDAADDAGLEGLTVPDDFGATTGGAESPLVIYQEAIAQGLRKVMRAVVVVFAVFVGFMGETQWRRVLMYFHGRDFDRVDPQFSKDMGFYAFQLPFIQMLLSMASLILFVMVVISVIFHYILGGIRPGEQLAGGKMSVTRAARVQLATFAGLWMLVRAASYWFDRYNLLSAHNGMFDGGSYTDINAVLPAKMLLTIIACVVAAAFFSAIVLNDLRIPAVATVLMLLSAFVIGGAWPGLVEKFEVSPNRQEKESEYIGRNIEATRWAYGLTDDKVTYERDWGDKGASAEAVASDAATLGNIRLLDPEILSATFTQQQQLKNFYGFPKTLNVDRYMVDGQLRDYVVAAREINANDLRDNQKDWINRHTVYTHGNGFIAAPANRVDEAVLDAGSTRGGYPIYQVSDLNGVGEGAKEMGLELEQPRIYYGPVIADVPSQQDYAIVGVSNGPVEYDTEFSNYTYEGKGGVPIGNIFKRALFAAKYGELKLILSDRIDGSSKIIFDRDPRSRVEAVAPWLTTDSATYPAVVDGRIKWIVDGYTTLSNLPYSQRTSLKESTRDSLNPTGNLQTNVNSDLGYIRNSVKATVDAYDGTVELYEFDDKDPVLKAWEGVFPDTVKPKSDIPEQLRDHLRYPEDMFKVQRDLITKYHVDDPRVFFTSDAFWSVVKDPNSTTKIDAEHESDAKPNQPPYYVVAADPKTGKPSYQVISPLRGLSREFLAAHMSVSSDPDNYGHITMRVLSTKSTTPGPAQAQDTMMSSDQIARDRSLWENSVTLKNGNLLTLPVGGGEILYVEPLYSERKDQNSAFPKLLRVLVSYNGKVGYAPTIAEALAQVGIDPRETSDLDEAVATGGAEEVAKVSDAIKADEKPADASKVDDAAGVKNVGGLPVATGDAAKALEAVNKALADLDAAKGKSFEEYGKALDALDRAVKEYQRYQ